MFVFYVVIVQLFCVDVKMFYSVEMRLLVLPLYYLHCVMLFYISRSHFFVFIFLACVTITILKAEVSESVR